MREEIHAYKRERILEEAVKLFYERGFTGTTLDDIAAELGVTKPFIYTHFRSKVELLAALCTPTIEMSLAAVENAAKGPGTPTQRLRRAIADFAQVILSRQANIAIFFREEKNLAPDALEEITRLRKRFDRKLSNLLAEGVAAGEFTVDDVSLDRTGHRRHDQLGLHVAPAQRPPDHRGTGGTHGRPDTADGRYTQRSQRAAHRLAKETVGPGRVLPPDKRYAAPVAGATQAAAGSYQPAVRLTVARLYTAMARATAVIQSTSVLARIAAADTASWPAKAAIHDFVMRAILFRMPS